MKIIIFILSYNDETYNCACEKYSKFKWAKIIKIETTILLESIMYDKWLIDNYDEWKNYDYIGFLSWKFEQKIKMPNFDNISEILSKDNSYEIIPLLIGDEKYLFKPHKYMYNIFNILYK